MIAILDGQIANYVITALDDQIASYMITILDGQIPNYMIAVLDGKIANYMIAKHFSGSIKALKKNGFSCKRLCINQWNTNSNKNEIDVQMQCRPEVKKTREQMLGFIFYFAIISFLF